MAIDTTGAITPDKLKPVEPLQTVTEPTPDLGGLLGTTESVAGQFQAISDEQKRIEELNKTAETGITSAMQALTEKEADTQTALKDTGATAASEQITNINAQAQSLFKEAQAIPIQIQQDIKGRGVTTAGAAPLQAARLRENALKALSLSQQYDIAKGNYDVAKQKADQIIAVKYKPLEDELALKQQQYLFNKDALERIDKKRTEALGIALKQKEADLLARKNAEQETYNRRIKESEIFRDQYNADRQFEQSKIQADRQFEQNQKEFGAQYALQVKAANLAEAKYRNDLIRQNTADKLKAIESGVLDTLGAVDTTKFTDKIKQIEEIAKSSGLAGAVGPNRLARDFGLGSLTGEKQAFIGNVQNLISADVLQTLVNLKKSGGTLGAVSEKELSLLQAASSRIGEWAKTDEQGKVLYYDVSEKEFKKELDRIKESTQRVVTAIEEQAFTEYLKIQNK